MDLFKPFIERLLDDHPEYPKETIAAILKNKALFPPIPTGEQLEFWDLPIRSFFLENEVLLTKNTVFLMDLIYEVVQYVLNDSLAMIHHHDNAAIEREERLLIVEAEAGLMVTIKGKGRFAALSDHPGLLNANEPNQVVALLRLHRLRRFSQSQPNVTHYFKLILAKRTGNLES